MENGNRNDKRQGRGMLSEESLALNFKRFWLKLNMINCVESIFSLTIWQSSNHFYTNKILTGILSLLVIFNYQHLNVFFDVVFFDRVDYLAGCSDQYYTHLCVTLNNRMPNPLRIK